MLFLGSAILAKDEGKRNLITLLNKQLFFRHIDWLSIRRHQKQNLSVCGTSLSGSNQKLCLFAISVWMGNRQKIYFTPFYSNSAEHSFVIRFLIRLCLRTVTVACIISRVGIWMSFVKLWLFTFIGNVKNLGRVTQMQRLAGVHVLTSNLLYDLTARNRFQLMVLYRFCYSRLLFSGLS